MYVAPQWTCVRCSTGNIASARFCATCGQPSPHPAAPYSRAERPWWRRKCVWTGIASATIGAVLIIVGTLAGPSAGSPESDDNDAESTRSAPNTDTFAAAYEAHIDRFFEAAGEFESSREIDAATLLAGGIGERMRTMAESAVAWADVSGRFRVAMLEHSAPTGCADFHLELIDAQNAVARIGQLGERFLAGYDGGPIPTIEGGWLPRFDAEHEASLDALTRARVLGADCGFLE